MPNVLKCPFCNQDLHVETDEYARKHLVKCALAINPRPKGRHPGRPTEEERQRAIAEKLGV